ncbi:MAG: succinate dehydrogenase/fumarate reductase iron-sulfur subunit, partial [Bowdeniella nasicola]|nr:succinate dehydrogenase/fumarate reductase iron-sulfur subunit [Bowdeniella nasicola]
MHFTLKIWRQARPDTPGEFATYQIDDLAPSLSVLEMLDALNDQLIANDEAPITFESDCREGICGACGILINARPHGPAAHTPACHQRLSSFPNGSTITIEPLRAAAFPVIADLMVERAHLTDVLGAGGSAEVFAGTAPDADADRIDSDTAERALDFAACIGCGACVAACPNGSAQLYVGAKLGHLSELNIAGLARHQRAETMVAQAESYFG